MLHPLALLLLLAQAQDKGDVQAREAVEKFMKAIKAEDLDALMKVCDVPFFQDGQKIIKDRDELKKEFAKVFQDKDLTQLSFEIKEVHLFDKIGAKLNEKDRELLKEVIGKEDRVVLVDVKVGDRGDKAAIMVRAKDGLVVGLRD